MNDMKILEEAEQLAGKRKVGEVFSWRELFGEARWIELSQGNPTGLGERLSKLVREGHAHSIVSAGIATSGRMNVYRRKVSEPIG